MLKIFIGRQPIYNKLLKVVGYELLFRSYDSETADFIDGDRATSQVIMNTFVEIGLDKLVGGGLAFINLTRNFILDKYPLPFSEKRVVLEVLENITIDDELIEGLRFLSGRGYQIALDDVVNPDQVAPLLEIADIVKLDFIDVDRTLLRDYVQTLKKYNVKLLAEKLETQDDFEFCKKLGFHLYQGFFFSRPHIVSARKIPDSHLNILRLLSKLHAPGIEFREVEAIVSQDVSLSYKLLRLINSSFYARSRTINSIRQALTLLGIKQIQDWVSLLCLASVEDKPRELMNISMIRAKMCELLTKSMKLKNAETGFIVGLFSVLDALLDMTFEDILQTLPLSGTVRTALINREGPLGDVLRCVLAFEQGNWGEARCPNVNPDKIRDSYLESVQWAFSISSML